jgi:hypothetical protein
MSERKRVAMADIAARKAKEEEEVMVGPEAPGPALGLKADYGTHLRPGAVLRGCLCMRMQWQFRP